MSTSYSSLALDHGYVHLIDVVTSSKFAVCTLVTLLPAAIYRLAETLHGDTRLQLNISYLVPLFASVIDVKKAVDVCYIIDETRYDMTISLIAWNVMKCVG